MRTKRRLGRKISASSNALHARALNEYDGCVADAATYDAGMAISAEATQLECVGETKGRRDGEQRTVSGEIRHPTLHEVRCGQNDVGRNVGFLPDRPTAFNAMVADWLSLAEWHLR